MSGAQKEDPVDLFLRSIEPIKDEFEGIRYRLILYDGTDGLRALRGWVVFEDQRQAAAVPRIDLGPCIWLEFVEPLDQGLPALLERIRSKSPDSAAATGAGSWTLPGFRRPDEKGRPELLEGVSVDWTFDREVQYWEDNPSAWYRARRLHSQLPRPQDVIRPGDLSLVQSALVKAGPYASLQQFVQERVTQARFDLHNSSIIEVFAPIRVRVVEATVKRDRLSATVETGLRCPLEKIVVGWQSFNDENDTSRNFHKGSMEFDPRKARRVGRTLRIPINATIRREGQTRVAVSYREVISFTEYVQDFYRDPAKRRLKLRRVPSANPIVRALGGTTGFEVAAPKSSRKAARHQARIFVGHSFSRRDCKPVAGVKAALRRMGARVLSGERSDAQRVSEKVKQRIRDADVFVGILSRRHRIKDSGRWTTSAWVVDEKGFALGVGKPVILLVERGVPWPDETGGLQGDIDHIPFDQTAVAEAFPKLREVIESLKLRLQPARSAGHRRKKTK